MPEAKAPEVDRKALEKKCKKEGGKRGVEIEGASDMGGLKFFNTCLENAQGDVELLKMSVEAMNEVPDPENSEERKGGAGRVAKMTLSAGPDQLAIVCDVPTDLQAEVTAPVWLAGVLADLGEPAEVMLKDEATDALCWAVIPKDDAKGKFPLKYRDGIIPVSLGFLRKKGLIPDAGDDSDDDEFVFGDEDFPS